MPIFQKGDMWSAYPEADLFLITTNSTLQSGNILVMGRGIAKQARERFPGLNKALGQQIAQVCGRNGQYGFAYQFSLVHRSERFTQIAQKWDIQHSLPAS